jgi:nitrate reductase (cytochrome), electron transfer subunit
MTSGAPPGAGTPVRVIGIGSAVAIMVAAILAVGSVLSERAARASYPSPAAPSLGEPIAAEAHVFRTHLDERTLLLEFERRAEAHPRSNAMFRSLRAYPGAPPRIPHGLTASEFRDARCNVCHERGGYVARFAAYVPVTPHPEYASCLQCHAPDDAVTGIALPDGSAQSICLQCHVPDRTAPVFRATNWRPPDWPRTVRSALPGSPPVIPHELQLRGNCLACHAGPGAVEEIRTTHPERANCRQCHMTAEPAADVFTRPLDGGGGG